MTRKRRRLYVLLLGLLGLGTATALTLAAFQDHLVFFYSPSDIASKPVPRERMLRIGGLVEPGSVARAANDPQISFRVTDNVNAVPVVFVGLLPDLFREGQGVVANGRLGADGVFRATEILARHDENYMPPEVAEALKRAGQWQHGAPPPGKASP
ncbi:MAG: cytochrome c maturation protein CcmE [Rhodospirillales bacterium]|jgi:cytochrome c-type biogenesis protein CcmE